MRFSELEGARVGVWGAGREIASFAAQLARRLPAARIAVAVFDTPPAGAVAELLGAPGVRVVTAAEAERALSGCELLVRSPGVTIHRPEIERLRAAGLPVTTATSLWLSERGGRGVLGVTGTKGKSTTAALAHHLARSAGADMHLAGNIGVPALDLLDAPAEEPAVVELSSYQIADLETAPATAVVTNLYREHLDWHGSEQAYHEEKLRLLGLPGLRAAVLPTGFADPPQLEADVERRSFGDAGGWHLVETGIARGEDLRVPAERLPLPGDHNALNLCAALAGLEAAAVPLPALPDGLDGFAGLPHRLQTVCDRDGVRWVDDSISTTPESALAALASFAERPLVLIAGGQDRGQDYAALAAELTRTNAALIALPTTGPRLLEAALAAGLDPHRALAVEDMASAVAAARARVPARGVVLLSPAAPSYDRYRDFEERGELFAALARDASAMRR
ncbi:MAG TPA: UDP-N-acetylmuramoyl-L-alanine--D-glutamate ligase [Solirubrobacteraceae bacterium]|jgi:UDP-N-acetylmuramoylalanine--D-glutamate ligase